MNHFFAAIVLALSLATPALAGNTSAIYGSQGQYQGRIVQHPGNNSAKVFDAQGRYQGRIVTQPDGSSRLYNSTGKYLGRSQPQGLPADPKGNQERQ
ncbi:hypothetical protein [Solidesulfovibrio carbinolicus]|uniref:Type IV secretion protein Rhs n=1 Tax=Solidesulfovibrio carbinolicus TaxID=296842 RepID=A0A4P6HQ14_9BACT|nr:hypothetical protein [Solidesulfovibrio carbinolicus]QAZ67288.1 hypothetical protein C3Y92_08635 [Solidesulfovibrio carbinolicus]